MTVNAKDKELAKRSEIIQFILFLGCWKGVCYVCALHLFNVERLSMITQWPWTCAMKERHGFVEGLEVYINYNTVTEFCVTFRAWHFLILDVADHVWDTWSCDTLNGVVFDLENCNFVEGTCIGFEARYFVEPYRFWQVYRNRSPLLLEIYWFRIKSIINTIISILTKKILYTNT